MRYRNWLSILGAVLTTVSGVLFLVFFVLDLAGLHTNPYFGIVTFILLPALFVTGLLLVPLGFWMARRRVRRGQAVPEWPVLDFGHANVRRTAIAVLALTGVNIAIVSLAAYKSVEYVDSTGFCTGACHAPMEPEAVAHQNSVHASISCSSCHVGPGASGFVDAKMGGVRRLKAVLTNTVTRPVPVPVHDLPASEGTCATCHTPDRSIGDRIREFRYYSDDETSTEQLTTLTLKVGGGGYEQGGPQGIHYHASPQTRVEYISTTESRDTIPWVRVTDTRGTREYAAEGVTSAQLAAGQRRVMDCTDCHNREGHKFAATPDRAVDSALARGLLPRTLPFIRREALAAAAQEYPDRLTAERQIKDRLTAFYTARPELAGDGRLAQAITATQRVYSTNVFPSMRVKWGTYPNQLGHTDAPGCFRCHDDLHKTTSGLVISQDCESCHRLQ